MNSQRKLLSSLIAILGVITVNALAGTPGSSVSNPIILGTPDYSNGSFSSNSAGKLAGEVFRYINKPSGIVQSSVSVSQLLTNPIWGVTNVGSFTEFVSSSNTINYGVKDGSPSYADKYDLSQFLAGSTNVSGSATAASLIYNYNNIYYPNNKVNNGTNGTFLTLSGFILVAPSAVNQVIKFTIGSDDGARLVLQGTDIIDEGGIHAISNYSSYAEFTNSGYYSLDIGYYDGQPVNAELNFNISNTVSTNQAGIMLVAPEPSTYGLFGLAALGFLILLYRRRAFNQSNH